MAIQAEDIEYRLSGGASNEDPAASLGGAMSSETVDASLNGFFDRITGTENANSTVDYRCMYVTNTSDTDTLYGAVLYIYAEEAGGASVAIGLDPAGKNGEATTIANETSAPDGVSFSAPTTAGAGLALGDLEPGDYYAFWIRRTAANSAAQDLDGVEFEVIGDQSE